MKNKRILVVDDDKSIADLFMNGVAKMQNLAITPVKESGVMKRRFMLEPGCCYLVEDDVKKAFKVFVDNVVAGLEGLCVTREFPQHIRTKYRLDKTPIVWLTLDGADGETTVRSLQDLSIMLGNYLNKARGGVILLDGCEYLITNYGFDSFLRFLQLNRSRIEREDSILIMPILTEALNPREVRLIEREMIPFTHLTRLRRQEGADTFGRNRYAEMVKMPEFGNR